MEQTFDPRQLPVVLFAPPAPPSAPVIVELFKAFLKGVNDDVRQTTRRRTDALLDDVATVAGRLPDGDYLIEGELDTQHDGAAGVTFRESPDGIVSFSVTICGADRRVFADLLDFAAAGLAAMDQHALSNDWQS